MTIAQTELASGRREAGSGRRARLEMPPSEHKPKPYTGPSRAEVLAMRRKYTNPAVFTL